MTSNRLVSDITCVNLAARHGVKPISDWTYQKRIRRAQRVREFAVAIANTNAFRFSKVYGVIHSGPTPTELPSAKHCVLFLWASMATLPDALAALTLWGVTYKTNFAWLKLRADPLEPGAFSPSDAVMNWF
jgi:N6-adenosine-specific RNA methylase IME4